MSDEATELDEMPQCKPGTWYSGDRKREIVRADQEVLVAKGLLGKR